MTNTADDSGGENFCDLCDAQVFIVFRAVETASVSVAFKRAGVIKKHRKFYCGACVDDGSGYPSEKYEQA